MDIKVPNVTAKIDMTQALEQARHGRLYIIGKMEEAIAQPRANMSQYAPGVSTPSTFRPIRSVTSSDQAAR